MAAPAAGPLLVTDRLDVHYQGLTEDGTRLQVSAFNVPAPAKPRLQGALVDYWPSLKAAAPDMELVSAHTTWGSGSEDMEHTWETGCFPYDPNFDVDD
jgi:hypothetical protein